jgi:uncharacterized protein YfaP (DUF2135 family)
MNLHRQTIACLAAAFLAWSLLAAPAGAQTPGSGESSSQPAVTVDFDGLVQLLKQKMSDEEILKRLAASPVHFVLSEEQIAKLQAEGASTDVIAALRRQTIRPIDADVENIGIVLDCSASMLDKLPDGSTKLETARKVLTDFIHRIGPGKNLTLVVYGIDPKKKCEDVHVVQKLARVTDEMKDGLEKYLRDVVPLGHTPLARAMEVAGAELAKEPGMCMLVVITDGMETCEGDPGEVAEGLVQKLNMPAGVDLIGLGVSVEEMRFLRAIARKGRPIRVVEAKKKENLDKSVAEAAERAKIEAKRRAELEAEAQSNFDATIAKHKGRSGELEFALFWFNKNDLDLHVIDPAGQHIFFGKRRSKTGGHLDVDMNVTYAAASDRPVEHIVWERNAPLGKYLVWVHHYKNHGKPDTRDPTYFKVLIKARGKFVGSFNGQLTWTDPKRRQSGKHEFILGKAGEDVAVKPPDKGPEVKPPPPDAGELAKIEAEKQRQLEEEAERNLQVTLAKHKARSGELEFALLWFNKNDLDLHVIDPAGVEISWKNKRPKKSAGHLDVDMNVDYATASNRPVEHIVWEKKAPRGKYKVWVEEFANHGKADCKDPTHFRVLIRHNGKIVSSFRGQLTAGDPKRSKSKVHEFILARDSGAAGKEDAPPAKADPDRDPLPGAPKVAWDARILEDNPEHFDWLKRTVTDDNISWVLQTKSKTAQLFTRALTQGKPKNRTSVYAIFQDKDDAPIFKATLTPSSLDGGKGEKILLTLKLPAGAVWGKTSKVILHFDRPAGSPVLIPVPAKGAPAAGL